MKTLKIDDKFSITYDENWNDSPLSVLRHEEVHQNISGDTPNYVIAMFYALLASTARVAELEAVVNHSRLAFAGFVSWQSAVNMIDKIAKKDDAP
jgi:hypothetical protein